MNARRDEETSAMEKLGARVRQRALTGFEASTVGFVLVVCIGVGAGIGCLLDGYFKTSFIVAIGTLLGAVLGFREMFRLTAKLTRQSSEDDARAARAQIAAALKSHPGVGSRDADESEEAAPESTSLPERNKPHIFTIPPPPTASFETKPERTVPDVQPSSGDDAREDDEKLIERLLRRESDEETPESGGTRSE